MHFANWHPKMAIVHISVLTWRNAWSYSAKLTNNECYRCASPTVRYPSPNHENQWQTCASLKILNKHHPPMINRYLHAKLVVSICSRWTGGWRVYHGRLYPSYFHNKIVIDVFFLNFISFLSTLSALIIDTFFINFSIIKVLKFFCTTFWGFI